MTIWFLCFQSVHFVRFSLLCYRICYILVSQSETLSSCTSILSFYFICWWLQKHIQLPQTCSPLHILTNVSQATGVVLTSSYCVRTEAYFFITFWVNQQHICLMSQFYTLAVFTLLPPFLQVTLSLSWWEWLYFSICRLLQLQCAIFHLGIHVSERKL